MIIALVRDRLEREKPTRGIWNMEAEMAGETDDE